MNFYQNIKENFAKRKIVILGDLVADQFLRGTIARVSREAPVFILSHEDTETLAGGGANAAVNVASLGGNSVAIGLLGSDSNGNELLHTLKSSNVNCDHVISTDKFQTVTKVRVLAGQSYAARQQVIRIDYENKVKVDDEIRRRLESNLISACENADAIIISDYTANPELGVVNSEIAAIARQIAAEKAIPIVVDSRYRLGDFRGSTSATPNQDEIEQILGLDFSEDKCSDLLERLDCKSLLITRGNNGMLLIEKDKSPLRIEAIGSKEPVDVTGAGDTVIAAYALSLASGFSFAESAEIANHAGGIVVMKKRTASVAIEELLESLKNRTSVEQKAQTK